MSQEKNIDSKSKLTLKEKLDLFTQQIFLVKENLFLSLFILTFILFHTLFNDLLKKFVVEPIISKAESTLTNTLILIIITIGVILFYRWANRRNYQPKSLYTKIIILSFSYHAFYRIFNHDVWNYYRLPVFSSLAYLDISFLILLFHLRLLLKNSKLKKENLKIQAVNSSLFTIDKDYLKNEKSDLLYRKTAADKLAQEILSLNSEESFAFGIVGEWGAGKTYFLDMILSHLNSSNAELIIIKFNPWRGRGNKKIIEHFFSNLKSVLFSYNGEIEDQIDRYIKKLLLLDKTEILSTIKNIFHDEISVEYEFALLNKTIKEINKKIIVSIDDLDRLDQDEICEVLKLIRNNANFYNVIFLAAYDKNYVTEAVKKINNHKPELYIEKIFQVEIALPAIKKEIIRDKFEEILILKLKNLDLDIQYLVKSFFKKDEFDISLDVIFNPGDGEELANEEIFLNNIKSLRDVTRLCNSFVYRYPFVAGFANFENYLLLEILKLKHLAIYDRIKSKFFLKRHYSKEAKSTMYLLDSKQIENSLSKYTSSEHEQNTALDLLKKIFKESHSFDKRSVVAIQSFDIYFTDFLHGKISLIEFRKAREKEYNDFIKQIDEWIRDEKKSDLFEIFYSIGIDDYANKEDFEKIIKSSFYLGHREIGFFVDNLLNRLVRKNLRQTINNFYENENDCISFITQEIKKYKNQPRFIPYIIGQMIRGHIYKNEKPIFTLENLQNFALSTLRNKIHKLESNSERITIDDIRELFDFYYVCIDSISEADSKVQLLPDAHKLIRSFVEKNPSSYLKSLIRPLYTPHDGKTFNIEPFTKDIFESFDNFEQFIEKQEPTFEVLELKTFYRKYKKNEFSPISFERNKIEFISDEKVKFTGSPSFPNLKSNDAITFDHPVFKNLQNRYPDLSEAKWISHFFPITLEEARKGGDYLFEFSFKLIYNNKKIKLANILFIVDDYLSLKINDKSIFKRQNAFNQSIQTYDITKGLSDGENIFYFTINNIVMENGDGRTNPYGLIFKIIIQFE